MAKTNIKTMMKTKIKAMGKTKKKTNEVNEDKYDLSLGEKVEKTIEG